MLTHELASHTPLVSVVMPVCNHDLYIEQALDSILAQRLDDLELIVDDDGSETPVDSLVYAKVPNAILIRQANTGPSAARNQGIVRARGRFVAFLDADDIWETTALKRLLKGFRDAPGAHIVQGNVRQFIVPGDAPSIDNARLGPPWRRGGQ